MELINGTMVAGIIKTELKKYIFEAIPVES